MAKSIWYTFWIFGFFHFFAEIFGFFARFFVRADFNKSEHVRTNFVNLQFRAFRPNCDCTMCLLHTVVVLKPFLLRNAYLSRGTGLNMNSKSCNLHHCLYHEDLDLMVIINKSRNNLGQLLIELLHCVEPCVRNLHMLAVPKVFEDMMNTTFQPRISKWGFGK